MPNTALIEWFSTAHANKAAQDQHFLAGAEGGLLGGTRVASDFGWRSVEDLCPGDLVMTFDHGLRPVVEIKRRALWSGRGPCPAGLMPIGVPAGVLENRLPLLLMPDQTVLIASDIAEKVLGDPFVLVPAAAFDGLAGCTRMTPHQRVDVIELQFDVDEIIYVNGAGLMHCPVRGPAAPRRRASDEPSAAYPLMALDMARVLVQALAEDQAAKAAGPLPISVG